MPSETPQTTVWRLALVLAAGCLALVLVSFGVGAVTSSASGPLEQWTAGSGENPDQHLNPETLESDSALGELDERLISEIRERAQSGALNLTQDDYERAREQLNDDQLDALTEEYGDSTSDDTSRSATIARAQESIANYTQAVAAFWEVHERYEQQTTHRWDGTEQIEFSESGGTTRLPGSPHSSAGLQASRTRESFRTTIRPLVANLTERATTVDELAPIVVDNYEALSGTFGTEYTETIEAVESSRGRILDTQETVLDEQYTETTISATVEPTNPSAVESVTVRGRLTKADGAALTTDRATIVVGNETYATATNETGWFNLSYRPSAMLRNETELPVRYAPGLNSTYLASETAVSLAVEPVEPTLETFVWTREVRPTESLAVSGRLTAESKPLPDVPYVITLGNSTLTAGITERGGRIDTETTIPETVPAGQQDLVVRVPYENRTLLPTNATTQLTVEAMPTTITMDVSAGDGQTVRVSGALTTAAETPVVNQSVYLTVAKREAKTVTTDENGRFEATIPVPATVSTEGTEGVSVPVTAVFDGGGTSLETTNEQTTKTLSIDQLTQRDGNRPSLGDRFSSIGEGSAETGGENGLSSAAIIVAAFVGVVVIVGTALFVVRRRGQSPEEQTEPDTVDKPTASTDQPENLDVATARELLAAGQTDAAVRAGYASVRRSLGDETAQTHWEFYQSYSDHLDSEAEQVLRDVTEAYERVAFADDNPDTDTADSVLRAVESLVRDRDAVPDGGTEADTAEE